MFSVAVPTLIKTDYPFPYSSKEERIKEGIELKFPDLIVDVLYPYVNLKKVNCWGEIEYELTTKINDFDFDWGRKEDWEYYYRFVLDLPLEISSIL